MMMNQHDQAENSFLLFCFVFFSPVEVTAHWCKAKNYNNLSLKGFQTIFLRAEAFLYGFKVGGFWLLIFFLIKGFNPSIFILHLSHCSELQKLANYTSNRGPVSALFEVMTNLLIAKRESGPKIQRIFISFWFLQLPCYCTMYQRCCRVLWAKQICH